MDAAAYESRTARIAQNPKFVSIRQKPSCLSQNALYGFNFVVEGSNRGWVRDRDQEGRWPLYLDWDGNGDLSATKPNAFAFKGGIQSLQVEIGSNGHGNRRVRFEIGSMVIEGSERLLVRVFDMTVRSGSAAIDGKHILPFRLHGCSGIYDDPHQTIEFDLEGSGKWERYALSEKFVNLGGKSYEFMATQKGDQPKLTSLAEKHPDHVSLIVGSQVPGFQAATLDGRLLKPADFSGKLLLVEFWATSCPPCRAEAPKLVEFYKDHRSQLSIIGISSDNKRKTLNQFVAQFNIEWPQINENWEGELHRLFRVRAEPTYFLIGSDGKIIDTWEGGGDTIDRIRRHIK